MKKLVLILFVVLISAQAVAEIDFYGSVRMGWWYKMTDKDYNGTEDRLEFQQPFYADSRIGFKFNHSDFLAKVEMKLTNTDVGLREAWAEQDLGVFKILVGRTGTGFSDFASQAYDTDRCLRGYGMMWDNYNTQVRLTLANSAYLILAEPVKADPAGLGTDNVDAIIPKINVGMKFNMGSLYVHPTFGINMSQYNEDFAGIDDSVMLYAFSTTFKYDMKPFCFKLQASYGQNIGNYGMMKPMKGTQGMALWDNTGNEVINTTVMGGYLEAKYADLALGLGYISESNDNLDDPDAAASAYLQYNYKLSKYFCLIPEVGMFDHMEDGSGNAEGKITYFGTSIRTTF